MTLLFSCLVAACGVLTLAGMVVEEIASRRLPDQLRQYRAETKAAAIALCKRHPALFALRLTLVVGYFLSLLALGLLWPYSPWAFLLCTVGWTGLSTLDAPQVLSRPFVPIYEAVLILNGMVLALSFFGPLSGRLLGGAV